MKQLKMKQKNKKMDFFDMLLSALGTSFLGSMPAAKGIATCGDEVIQVGEAVIRAGQDF